MADEKVDTAAKPEQLTGRPKGWDKYVEGVIVVVKVQKCIFITKSVNETPMILNLIILTFILHFRGVGSSNIS